MMLRAVSASTMMATRAAAGSVRAVAVSSSRRLSSMVALEEEYSGTPATMPSVPPAPSTKMSTLSNGAKVVTHENSQLAGCVGLVVGSGSRDETTAHCGASMLLQGMAYKRTQERSSIRLHRDVETAGGVITAIAGREAMTYIAACPPEGAEVVLEAIAESVVKPKIVPWEMKDAKAKLEQVNLRLYGECSAAQVEEALHAAAFGDSSPLGRPLNYGPCTLSHEALIEFQEGRYKAPGMTVVGVNVPHESLAAMAEAALEGVDASAPPARKAARFIAGELRIRAATPTTSISIGLSAPPASDSSAPAYEVLAAVLDARAKAATPAGSGFGYSYSDAGLVGVTGTVEHAEVGALAHSLIGCLKGIADGPSPAEVEAAVAAASVSRLLKMESPSDAGLALAKAAGSGADPAVSALEGVNAAAVKAAAAAAVKSGLSVAVVGQVGEVPHKIDIEGMI